MCGKDDGSGIFAFSSGLCIRCCIFTVRHKFVIDRLILCTFFVMVCFTCRSDSSACRLRLKRLEQILR